MFAAEHNFKLLVKVLLDSGANMYLLDKVYLSVTIIIYTQVKITHFGYLSS